jgi:hypothetical protein
MKLQLFVPRVAVSAVPAAPTEAGNLLIASLAPTPPNTVVPVLAQEQIAVRVLEVTPNRLRSVPVTG